MQFGLLRVLNDDIVAPGMGFGLHPHDNMEIVTIPLRGALEHRDTMGNSAVINPGEVQIMSAGTGLQHAEVNPSKTQEVELLQIWVFPKEQNIEPRYDQRLFDIKERENKFHTVVAPNKSEDTMWINQDAWFSLAQVEKGKQLDYTIKHSGNGAYLFIINGKVNADGQELNKRDALGLSEGTAFTIAALEDAEILVIDVPMH
jgi:hypothetical protein